MKRLTRWRHRLPGPVLEDDPAAARRRGALDGAALLLDLLRGVGECLPFPD
ncbi:hypothetical protein ACFV08_17120 [Streptomyces fradiae]|uniref:hypothetical protein n=1 Tax=Streptomyces fradiae TaxID=1906 RepID=UPI003692AA13